jgi:hypothetical protein
MYRGDRPTHPCRWRTNPELWLRYRISCDCGNTYLTSVGFRSLQKQDDDPPVESCG